jgi:2-(1,2-epoxy-1,2-dihydrophenyl)acetyl-CoA isomerase
VNPLEYQVRVGERGTAMAFSTITLAIEDNVATVTLNRPDRLNSFTEAMHEDLRGAIREVKSGGARALLITGAGRGFCAGQDLTDRANSTGSNDLGADAGSSLERNYNPLVKSLRDLELPVIAAVNGVAAGAGASLALACDLVLAARSSYFLQAFCHIGLIPDAGGTYFLPRAVGQARALGLAMLGDRLPAEDAERWGLIWKCVDDDKLMPEAQALAKKLAKGPTRGLALIKQAIRAGVTSTLDEQLALEAKLQSVANKTEDFREGVTAFVEKRPAQFKGR